MRVVVVGISPSPWHGNVVGACSVEAAVGCKVALHILLPYAVNRNVVELSSRYCAAQKYADRVSGARGAEIGDGDVRASIPIEIGSDNEGRTAARRIRLWRAKCPVAYSGNHRHRVIGLIGCNQVGDAIGVEHTDRNAVGPASCRIFDLLLEGAITISDQYANLRRIVAPRVSHSQVNDPVAFEISRSNAQRSNSYTVGLLRLKRTVAIALIDEYADGIVILIDHRQVRESVTVEVSRDDAVGTAVRTVAGCEG